jgi:undecaprenyl-diphosphatase
MNFIARLDAALFGLVNGGLTTPALDLFMPFITDINNFVIVIALAIAGLVIFGGSRGRWVVLLLILAIAASDLTSGFFKNLFMRARPCDAIEGARLLSGCGGSFSFPSSHASNIFTAMVLLSTRYRRLWPAFLSVAFLVAYSRVYVGVHYPIDVAAGTLLGTAIALGFSEAGQRAAAYVDARLARRRTRPMEPVDDGAGDEPDESRG